jgi:molybdopterin converting factor small subunit
MSLPCYARGEKVLSLPWHPNMQIQEVIDILKIPDTIEWVIIVNSRYSEPDKELAPDDIIIIFPPVAGG